MSSRVDSTRRRFFTKAGVALTAPLAFASAGASGNRNEDDARAMKARLGELENANAIRELQRCYVKHVNGGAREAVAALFANPARASFDENIRGLSTDELGVDVAVDGRTAVSKTSCTMSLETPIEPRCPLVDMARQQGGGVVRRSERCVLDTVYVKQNGVWKIERLAYRSA
jgi:hypothetical protein